MSPQARRYDERDVRIRPGRGSRPRTKQRPEHADAESALVTAVDRGRYAILVDPDGPDERVAIAMKARELGRDRVVPGDEELLLQYEIAADDLEDVYAEAAKSIVNLPPYERLVQRDDE